MEFLLEDYVVYSVVHRGYKTVLLLHKALVGLFEVTVAAVLHVETAGVVQPSRHCHLVVELHHLGQDLLNRLLRYLLLQVPRQLHKVVIH